MSTLEIKTTPETLAGLPELSAAPIVVFWETTRACALKCLHCRAVAHPYRHPLELTTDEGFHLMDDLASFEKNPIVVLSGGDPFMRPDLFDLLTYAIEKGLRTSLSPSATRLVTPEALQKLKDLGLSRLSFSLDGATPEIHDRFRGVPGSFKRTQECIHNALEAGLSLHVNTTVCRYNLEDLPNLAQLLTAFPGIFLWDLFFLVPTGRGQRDDVISAEDHERVYHWLYDLAPQVPFHLKTTLGQHYRRVAFQRSLEAGKAPGEARMPMTPAITNDGKGVCFISHIGEIYPSGFLPVVCGNVRRDSIVNVYQFSPIFQALRDPQQLKGKCGRCPFKAVCGGCRARAYAYTRDYLETEPCCIFQPDGPEALRFG